MSNFSFVSDNVLRNNLDKSFNHILDLLTLSESNSYKSKKILASSLRKTIVIHTASIIEALLLWKLKREVKNEKVKISNEWKHFNIKVLYKINESEEVIAGRRKQIIKKIDKLDFHRIIDLYKKYKITNTNFVRDLHRVRKLRNRLHIGSLMDREKEYTKKDLNFVFDIAKEVKKIVSA